MAEDLPLFEDIVQFANYYKTHKDSNSKLQLFSRIFDVHVSEGKSVIPETFHEKIAHWYGFPEDEKVEDAVKRASCQVIVKLINRWSCQQTAINKLRSKYSSQNTYRDPKEGTVVVVDKPTHEEDTKNDTKDCDFCHPLEMTAEDLWGRLENESCYSAANVARYDGNHGMVIFKEHDPLHFSLRKFEDIMNLSVQWFEETNKIKPQALYPMVSWNVQTRAGASQHHGHLHLLLAEHVHFAEWERMQQTASLYNKTHAGADYFSDYIKVHQDLHLTRQFGKAWMAIHVSPYLECEIKVFSWNYGKGFRKAMACAIQTLIATFNSKSFNFAVHFPPMENGTLRQPIREEDVIEINASRDKPLMPFIAHMVDRGDPSKKTSDVGTIRFYGTPVVVADPFELIKMVK